MFILSLFFVVTASAEEVYVVDCNGEGDFSTIQECFDALPSKPKEWRTVRIKDGVYREKVTLDVYKDKVCIVAENRLNVHVVWDDHTGRVVDGHEMTTYDTATMSVCANDVYIDGLIIENDAPLGSGQAVALETLGDRIWINHSSLIGNQDTFFTRSYVSRILVENTYIEGTTDFIFGPSIAFFNRCAIHCKADSFITAASTTERNLYGYIFLDCDVSVADNVRNVYLGRPWKSTARTMWVRCHLPREIRAEGWRDWHDSAAKGAVFYAEYGCTGEGADRSGRVPWSKELTLEEIYESGCTNIDRVFAKKTGSEQFYDDWRPRDNEYIKQNFGSDETRIAL